MSFEHKKQVGAALLVLGIAGGAIGATGTAFASTKPATHHKVTTAAKKPATDHKAKTAAKKPATDHKAKTAAKKPATDHKVTAPAYHAAGVIGTVDEKAGTVTVKVGKVNDVFDTTAKTVVEIAGKKSALGSLKAGEHATITYMKSAKALDATAIDVAKA